MTCMCGERLFVRNEVFTSNLVHSNLILSVGEARCGQTDVCMVYVMTCSSAVVSEQVWIQCGYFLKALYSE